MSPGLVWSRHARPGPEGRIAGTGGILPTIEGGKPSIPGTLASRGPNGDS